MKIRTVVFAAAIGLGPGVWLAQQALAQPEWDVVHVNLPYTVMLGHKTLPAGDYTIQQLHSEGSTVLLFYNGNGMKFETSALTIPAVGNTDETRDKTSVTLHHIGTDYYFDKIWIQGKDYGYEFPLPAGAKEREKEMTAVSVPAQATVTSTAAEPTDNNNIDNNTTTSTTTAAPPAAVDNTPPAADMAQPPQQSQVTTDTAQTAPSTDTTISTESSANREKTAHRQYRYAGYLG